MLKNKRKKIRLVLLSYDSLYANPVFMPLFDLPFIEISAVVISDCIFYRKGKFASLMFFLRKHGLKYFAFKAFDQFFYVLFGKKKFMNEVKKRKIPVLHMKDVNSPDSLLVLKSFKPDLMISYFNQILKKDCLDIARRGNLNIHPGYLPLFRGVASSFWAMKTDSKFGGVTVHFMAEKLDVGDIVKKGKVTVGKDVSLHKHNFLSCKLGGELLVKALEMVYKGKVKRKSQTKGDYYSWPRSNDVDEFLTKGFKLIAWDDLKLY